MKVRKLMDLALITRDPQLVLNAKFVVKVK